MCLSVCACACVPACLRPCVRVGVGVREAERSATERRVRATRSRAGENRAPQRKTITARAHPGGQVVCSNTLQLSCHARPADRITVIEHTHCLMGSWWADLFCLHGSKYKLLESRLEETVQQTLKIKEEKISCLEKKLEESRTLNTTLRAKLTPVSTRIKKLFWKIPVFDVFFLQGVLQFVFVFSGGRKPQLPAVLGRQPGSRVSHYWTAPNQRSSHWCWKECKIFFPLHKRILFFVCAYMYI